MTAKTYRLAMDQLIKENPTRLVTNEEIDERAGQIERKQKEDEMRERALVEQAEIAAKMFKTIRRLTVGEALAEDHMAIQGQDAETLQDTTHFWIDAITDWWFAEQTNGKYYTMAFNEDEEHTTPQAAIEWLKERFSY